jgi:hypothetical protein
VEQVSGLFLQQKGANKNLTAFFRQNSGNSIDLSFHAAAFPGEHCGATCPAESGTDSTPQNL